MEHAGVRLPRRPSLHRGGTRPRHSTGMEVSGYPEASGLALGYGRGVVLGTQKPWSPRQRHS